MSDGRGFRQRAFAAVIAVLLSLAMTPLLRATPPKWWMAGAFSSGPIIFAARAASPRTLSLTALLGVGFAAAYQALHPQLESAPIALAYGVGVACIVASFALVVAGDRSLSRERVRTALIVSMFPAKTYIGILLLGVIAARTPETFDSALSAVDQSLGGNLSFLIGRALDTHGALRAFVVIAYNLLPMAVMYAAALRWRRLGAADPTSIPLAAAIAAAIGVMLYVVVPAAGPVFRWGSRFPLQPPTSAELTTAIAPLDVGAFRNAMPSLHFAGALFVAWGTWSLGTWQRFFGVVFLALMFIATLGLGEHYLIDLIVAIPYAVAIEAVVRRWPRWPLAFGLSAGITMAWMATLRVRPEILVVPGVTWIGVIVTLGACIAIARQRADRLHVARVQPARVAA